MKLLRIVPGPVNTSGLHTTHGTQVLTPSGESIPGVTRITLEAGVDDRERIWRATIECFAIAPEITADAIIGRPVEPAPESRKRRRAGQAAARMFVIGWSLGALMMFAAGRF